MNIQSLRRFAARAAKSIVWLQDPFLLATRIYVAGDVFLRSGYGKITNWDQTLGLFEEIYRVPVLSPFWAAVTGTASELALSILLITGFGGRLPALGLSAVNVVAVVSLWYEFSTDSGIAGLRQHYLWGFMLATLFFFGSGRWSLDQLLARRAAKA